MHVISPGDPRAQHVLDSGMGLTFSVAKPKPSIASMIRFTPPKPLTFIESVPTAVWFALGAVLVGGGTYYILRRGRS